MNKKSFNRWKFEGWDFVGKHTTSSFAENEFENQKNIILWQFLLVFMVRQRLIAKKYVPDIDTGKLYVNRKPSIQTLMEQV